MVSDQRLREAAVKLRGMSATAEPWINQVVAERLAELLEAIERLPQPLHIDVLQIVVDARYLARAVNACEECRNHWTTWHYAGDLRAAGLIDQPGMVPCVMPACDGRDTAEVAADQKDLRERLKREASRGPFGLCPCGHAWMAHDIAEYDGDGSDLCCVQGCSQEGCPGRKTRSSNKQKGKILKPSIGRIVHYVSYGTPGGEYPSVCRAAVVSEVSPDTDDPFHIGLVVLNPTGMFFHALSDGGCHYFDNVGSSPRGGTWHWPERVDE